MAQNVFKGISGESLHDFGALQDFCPFDTSILNVPNNTLFLARIPDYEMTFLNTYAHSANIQTSLE